MSAKPVKKYIRQQRRAAKRAARQERRAARQQERSRQTAAPQHTVDTELTGSSQTATRPSAHPVQRSQTGRAHASAGTPRLRLATVVAGAALLLSGGVSAVLAPAPHQEPAGTVLPAYTAAGTVHLPALCREAEVDEDAGLISPRCQIPQRRHVFLGPETGTGSVSEIILTNPYDRQAAVEVTTFDTDGERGALGATTVLVPAESSETINLAGLAPEQTPLAVEVTASSAPVLAYLETSRASGSTPLGAELLPAQSAVSTEHVMPAVPIPGEDAETTAAAELWLYVPGTAEATVELQAFNTEGQQPLSTPGVFQAPAGEVFVVDLEGLPEAGVYDVVVHTDVPTYAAVRSPGDGTEVEVELEPEVDPITGEELEPQTEQGPPEADFSFSVARQPLAEEMVATVPEQAEEAQLRLMPTGQGTARLSYHLLDADGTPQESEEVEVPPGSGASVELGDASGVVVEEVSGTVHAAVLSRDEAGRFSIADFTPAEPAAERVPVILQPAPGRVG
ncbi:DUF5719 family protein [Nesterenkonia alba]|uniref:DUF5719 family protein n=1 Tax=Nesterenkonia alba TaxID=515814 RepID=UPI0003B362B0|nr:DUF5719 family protein [Nesterenkonia alba]